MTDKDLKTIFEKLESLHDKILKSRFAETVRESEMMALVLAVRFLREQQSEIERLNATNEIAAECIKRQDEELEKLRKERDIAIKDVYNSTKCFICKSLPSDGNMTRCPNYSSCGLAYNYFK